MGFLARVEIPKGLNSGVGAGGAAAVFNRCGELVFDIPGEVDPLVLLKFFHARVDDGATGGLGVKRREVGFG